MFRHEKLEVYHLAREFNKEIGVLILTHRNLAFYLQNQLGRAGLSIPLNIAEGYARQTDKDQRHFFVIAHGSIAEVSALLDHLLDMYPNLSVEINAIKIKAESLSKMIYRFIHSRDSRP